MNNQIQRPHYTNPIPSNAYVLLCYRNFMAKDPAHCHIALGVNCLHTAKCLRQINIHVDIVPIWTAQDLTNTIRTHPTVTHIVIEAPFISARDLLIIMNANPGIAFTCRTHSQIGFLQVEAGAIQLIRDYLRLQDENLNFSMSVNSHRFGIFLQEVYNSRALLLPNLYYLDIVHHRTWQPPSKLIRIGSFGAIRLQKNHPSAAAAALIMTHLHRRDLEFSISVNREAHGKGVVQALRNMFDQVPHATLVEVPWAPWSDFRRIISNMDLHIQASVSESFNITSADAVAEGVPAIGGESIDWLPRNCIVSVDNVNDIATKAWEILNSPTANEHALASLKYYNHNSLNKWIAWRSGNNKTMTDLYIM